jgi:hypothetical protein
MTLQASDYIYLINRTDPSRGFVNYLDKQTAMAQGLVKVNKNNQLYIGVDNRTVINSARTGRGSVRLESKESWSSGLLVADIAHMPGNQCGVWPAL